MNLDDPSPEDADREWRWKWWSNWFFVTFVALSLYLLTFNQLLAGVLPYLRAGFPAVRTAFWLRTADPWPARGRAGFWFHLAMGGFRSAAAGCCGLYVFGCVEVALKRPADMNQVIVVGSIVLFGFGTSFLFGWIGLFAAMRHRIRIFVASNLYSLCRGSFARATTLPMPKVAVNPAKFVATVAVTIPMLTLWGLLLVVTIPADGREVPTWLVVIQFGSLPLVIIGIAVGLAYVFHHVIAATPVDCWGVPVPETPNWYRAADLQ